MIYKFSDIIEINPRESIPKGKILKKIAMQDLLENTREVQGYTVEEYKSGSKFRQGDTLFSRITPCLENGKIAQVNILEEGEIAFGSTEFIILRAKKDFTLSDYVYHLSKWNYVRELAIKSMTGTSGRQRVQNAVFDEIIIDLPSINEQQIIVNILNAFDQKIEINNKIIANLEEQAQAIFKSWFVDFEPFQDDDFVESELGLIPEGWDVKKVNDICNLKIGRTPPRKEEKWFSDRRGVKWISIKDMGNSNMFIDKSTEYLTEEAVDKFNVPLADTGVLLLSFKLTVGRLAITSEPMCTNEAIAQFSDSKLDSLYLYLYFKEFHFSKLGNTSSIGNAVNSKIIKDIDVLVPEKTVQERFADFIGPIANLINNLNKENNTLSQIRDTLLPKLMSGEIDVSNINIDAEEECHV